MTRRILIALVLVGLLSLGGFASAQVVGEENTKTACATATASTPERVIGVDADPVYTIPGDTATAIECVTVTADTVTETTTTTATTTVTVPTTTTEPEPPTTTTEPEPPPASQPNIVQTSTWVCTGPQDRDLVRITMSNGSADAIQFRQDCSGRIGRIEVEGRFADCLKVNPPAPPAHDLVIESGYCHSTQPPSSGIHQDCIQAGGGGPFSIRNFVFDCIGGGGGNFYINSFNGGTPHDFICDGCAFGPRHPNQIRPESDPNSGVSNSLVCESLSGRRTFIPDSGDKGGNLVVPSGDPRCSFDGLLAYVGG